MRVVIFGERKVARSPDALQHRQNELVVV